MTRKNEAISGDFRKYMDKNYFGSWDIPAGQELTVTIDHAEVNEVQNDRGTEAKLTIHLQGDYKPVIVNATNGQAISTALGSSLVEDWAGKRIILYVEKVRAFGKTVDAVRVRDYAPRDEIYCDECGQEIKATNGYSPKAIAASSKKKYGRCLCWDCVQVAKAIEEEDNGTDE